MLTVEADDVNLGSHQPPACTLDFLVHDQKGQRRRSGHHRPGPSEGRFKFLEKDTVGEHRADAHGLHQKAGGDDVVAVKVFGFHIR